MTYMCGPMPPTREDIEAAREFQRFLAAKGRESRMTEYDTVAFDNDARRYLELDELLSSVQEEMSAIKARFRTLGEGAHKAPCGVAVQVSPPNRSFNLTKAVGLLNDEQRELCKADGYDPKKVKGMLPPVVLEICMDPGKGDARVSVK